MFSRVCILFVVLGGLGIGACRSPTRPSAIAPAQGEELGQSSARDVSCSVSTLAGRVGAPNGIRSELPAHFPWRVARHSPRGVVVRWVDTTHLMLSEPDGEADAAAVNTNTRRNAGDDSTCRRSNEHDALA